jgi:hypothetical protein
MNETYDFLALTGSPSTWASQMEKWKATNTGWAFRQIVAYQELAGSAPTYWAMFFREAE